MISGGVVVTRWENPSQYSADSPAFPNHLHSCPIYLPASSAVRIDVVCDDSLGAGLNTMFAQDVAEGEVTRG